MKIKGLTVKVTYTVSLGELEVSEKVGTQIAEVWDKDDRISGDSLDYDDALSWMTENIKEADCLDWEVEIFDFVEQHPK